MSALRFFKTSFLWDIDVNYTVSQKKRDTILLSTVSPNIDRFSKFFHRHTQQETCNKEIIKDSTTPQTRRYTTLWNMNVDNYKQSETG